jgi:hypothetical protein
MRSAAYLQIKVCCQFASSSSASSFRGSIGPSSTCSRGGSMGNVAITAD